MFNNCFESNILKYFERYSHDNFEVNLRKLIIFDADQFIE